ncbi:Ig-like domain-containing protein [Spongisporangium articulatum]|uniref:Ig-like domain-containing protein n=1 Tax=Spongisporangium articulatum TaxID=3362603 RepID=A0ABW8ASY1_9ACTN
MQYRSLTLVGVVVTLVAGLTACGPGEDGAAGPKPQTVSSPAAKIDIAPGDGTRKWRLDKPIAISVLDGTLASVSVTSKGHALDGQLSPDQRSWKSIGVLKPGAEYTVSVAAANQDGLKATSTSSFTTLSPSARAQVWMQPAAGSTVGVGMPVVLNFSAPVAKSRQAAVEKGLSVTSDPLVEGDWKWMTAQQVQWRPKAYWPSGVKVKVRADLAGVELAKGVWGASKTAKTDFTIGSEMISTVDVDKHTMTVRRGGKVIRTIPITTGKAGYETRNGVKVIMTHEATRRMDAASTGTDPDDPEYYNILVHYAMRLTYSGEFLHAAPWSVGSQGRANVSHGCTGMSMSNAQWMFDHSKIGDVVVYKNSKRPLEWGNGFTAWDVSYDKWTA